MNAPQFAIALSLASVVFLSSFAFQSDITISDSSVAYEFGRSMTFRLAAGSPAGIVQATLFVEIRADSRTKVTEAAFTTGPQITAEVTRDLQAEPVAPFSSLAYWWQVIDGAGAELTTERATLFYDDNRFEWQTAERAPVTVHWHAGDLAFGQAAADLGALALPQISHDVGAAAPAHIDVYIYASVDDLQHGLELNGRSWVGGHADPALGVVLVAAEPVPEGLLDLQRDVPHELTHVLIYQATTPNYQAVPAWLNEGLAVLHESQPNPALRAALERAQNAGELIPLESLCGAFPLDAAEATLAYAQSASVVGYIRDRWGSDRIVQLLRAYSDGATCEGGVQRALQTSLAGLDRAWAGDVLNVNPFRDIAAGVGPWVLVFLIPCVALAGLLFVPRRRPAAH